MRKILKEILLVDDYDADNFLHLRAINKIKITENIKICRSSSEALDYLSTKINGAYPCPDFLFLDINMSGMNGWEFIEKYKELEPSIQKNTILCMLTTSFSNEDIDKADEQSLVKEYINKPLTQDDIFELIDKYKS